MSGSLAARYQHFGGTFFFFFFFFFIVRAWGICSRCTAA
jgi:hypothetical protein